MSMHMAVCIFHKLRKECWLELQNVGLLDASACRRPLKCATTGKDVNELGMTGEENDLLVTAGKPPDTMPKVWQSEKNHSVGRVGLHKHNVRVSYSERSAHDHV